jgi:S-adenosylmethionine:tRNA ribosyltransferase-isomerase
MRTEEFDYSLPSSLIAQYPSPQRGDSRLMVLRRTQGIIEHRDFRDILEYFHPGDLLVMNNTRVLPARLFGKKESRADLSKGDGNCEFLLIPPLNGNNGIWEVLIKRAKKIKEGTRIQFEKGLFGEVKGIKNGKGKIRFDGHGEVIEILQKIGHIPLPPYIKRKDELSDKDRYQTIYAERDGSIAAPTAGLHFTHSLIRSLRDQGIIITMITLHIGIGTFAPEKVKNIEDHAMEPEWIEISEKAVKEIEKTKQKGRRVVAVGTTTTKTLESFADSAGRVKPGNSLSSLLISPPYRFRVVDALITNFHLPKSTLIMLTSAFAGKDLLMKAYREAIDKKYRFYSYGDAMLIL